MRRSRRAVVFSAATILAGTLGTGFAHPAAADVVAPCRLEAASTCTTLDGLSAILVVPSSGLPDAQRAESWSALRSKVTVVAAVLRDQMRGQMASVPNSAASGYTAIARSLLMRRLAEYTSLSAGLTSAQLASLESVLASKVAELRELIATVRAVQTVPASGLPTSINASGPTGALTGLCSYWSGSPPSLQTLVYGHQCVFVLPGTYTLSETLRVPQGHIVAGPPGTVLPAVLRADRGSSWGVIGVVATGPIDLPSSSIPLQMSLSGLTVDGSADFDSAKQMVTYDGANVAVTASKALLEGVHVEYARCDGINTFDSIGLVGPLSLDLEVIGGVIERNGAECIYDASPPGAGVYIVQPSNSGPTGRVQFLSAQIINNDGPGIDDNEINGGTITNSTITNTGSYTSPRTGNTFSQQGSAAVQIGSGSNWTITGNTITQPSDMIGKMNCTDTSAPAPYDVVGSSGLLICARAFNVTGNYIANNTIKGRFGIFNQRVLGRSNTGNTFLHNTLSGSSIGCAEHSAPGANQWLLNNCQGAVSTSDMPSRF